LVRRVLNRIFRGRPGRKNAAAPNNESPQEQRYELIVFLGDMLNSVVASVELMIRSAMESYRLVLIWIGLIDESSNVLFFRPGSTEWSSSCRCELLMCPSVVCISSKAMDGFFCSVPNSYPSSIFCRETQQDY
jgi:hypothetical protein